MIICAVVCMLCRFALFKVAVVLGLCFDCFRDWRWLIVLIWFNSLFKLNLLFCV